MVVLLIVATFCSIWADDAAAMHWGPIGEIKLTASDGISGAEFGYSFAAFGNRMVTGAHFAESTAGVAYVLPLKP